MISQSSAPEDGRNCRPKHVELIEIINKIINKIIIVTSSWLLMHGHMTIKFVSINFSIFSH